MHWHFSAVFVSGILNIELMCEITQKLDGLLGSFGALGKREDGVSHLTVFFIPSNVSSA